MGFRKPETRRLRRMDSAKGRSEWMRIVVDLNRCQTYGQCVFAAPTVFELRGEEILEYEYAPDDSLREQVKRAAAACPVQAISIGRTGEQKEE
jgi:ferredoxin